MAAHKFNPAKIARLDDPGRLDDLIPQVMWDALGQPDARTIADVGAGTGVFAEQFAALAPGAVVFALDTEPAMLDWIAEKRAALVDAGRLVPMLSEESRLPLGDGTADLAIMINMHHEIEDPRALYADVARILAPGGQLLVVDWAKRETPKGPPLESRADAEEIASTLLSAGFVDVTAHEGLPHHSLLTARTPS